MVKWVLLFFVVALVASGWYALRPDAPGWAPAFPTLVIAAGVITGLVYAIRWGLRRRKEMAAVAAQLGVTFEKSKSELRDSGMGVLKQFAHCRHKDALPFLHRGRGTRFENVMTAYDNGTEIFLFDYTTSSGSNSGPNYHGLFACFRNVGSDLPDLEIVPRLWGEQPAWLRYFTDLPPARHGVGVQHASFNDEYMIYTADEDAAQSVLRGDLLDRLSEQSGWRIEMTGEWVAVTRLGPGKKIGGLADPMEPEKVTKHDRYSYHVSYIAPRHIPRFYEEARGFYRVLTGR